MNDGYDRCPSCKEWALPNIGESDAVACQKCGLVVYADFERLAAAMAVDEREKEER